MRLCNVLLLHYVFTYKCMLAHRVTYLCYLLFSGSLGWQAREVRRLHPSVSRIIVAELKELVLIGRDLPQNIVHEIEFVKGGPI